MSAAADTAFDAHTAVEPHVSGCLRATMAPELRGFRGAMGGYVAALALRAMATVVDADRPPRSLHAQLLAAVRPGDLDIYPLLERSGSSMSVASLRVEQEGRRVVAALAAFGRPTPSLAHTGLAMPDVPGPDECAPIADKPVAEAEAGLLVEHRPAAPPLPLTGGGQARLLVWMRLVEERPVDALLATMLADAGPPALFGRLSEFVAMPSTDITLQFADLAAAVVSPWVLADLRTTHAADGYATEDGELWTPDARLVLQVRQLRRVLEVLGP